MRTSSFERFPEILYAFRKNVQLFADRRGAHPLVGLVLAMMRSLPGPVFFPFRAVAIVYVDFFRGVPSILIIYILGFGIPALGLEGVPRPTRSSGPSWR